MQFFYCFLCSSFKILVLTLSYIRQTTRSISCRLCNLLWINGIRNKYKYTHNSLAVVRFTCTVIFTFHFNFVFTCQISHDMIALNLYHVPHHCSTSTVFSLLHPLPVVPIKHTHAVLAVNYKIFQICVQCV